MKCPKCKSEIEDGSKFCYHCGANIQAQTEKMIKKSFTSSKLLLIWTIVFFVCTLAGAILENTTFWFEQPWRTLYVMICIILNLAFLLIPFAINKKPYKVVAFVLIGILVVYRIFNNINFLIN